MIIFIGSIVGVLVFLFPSATEDTNGPTVEINSPVNIIYDSPTHLLTITASDNVAVDTIWYNWKGENVTYFSAYYISFDEGLNIINAWANDSAGNKGTTSVTFSIDTTDPIVEIETPVNTIYNNATQLLTISTSDNVAVDTIWYNWNGENFTYTSQDSVTFNEGLNTIHAWVNDSVGHLGTTSETFTIDTTVPIIEINSLVNSTYYFPTQLLNISASDDVAVDTIWYNWNNINVIYSSAHYITFTEGLKTIHVWANDSVGNIGTTPLTFTMDIIDLDLTFVTEWNTSFSGSGGSSSSNQIKLPLELGGIYNFTVNWGDGNNNRILSYNQPEITHTYASEGVYTIEIKGILIGWRFNGGGDKLKLLEIKEWGAMRLGNSGGYFNGCTNLNLTASDTLDLTGTTSLYRAFSGCQSLGATGIMNNWDVSRVTNMYYMFIGANSFNQDISNWDVSRVTNMGGMFYYAPSFNQDISNWEVSSVTSMSFMFHGASLFNQSIGKWNVSNVKQMDRMLAGTTSFNRPIGNWSVSRVTTMAYMFAYASIFNQSIDDWNVSSVTDMTNMFDKAYDFNQPIGNWDVSSVKIMTGLFSDASSFNQSIGNWNVSSVTDMMSMFIRASSFNQPIGNWDVSSVKTMTGLFAYASSFNQPIGNWSVSSVTSMASMFAYASSFNQNISKWDVSGVNYAMQYMFRNASSFNQDIGNWDISNVVDMHSMFANATSFDQDIGDWDVSGVHFFSQMFSGVTLSTLNYDNLLIGWEKLTLWSGAYFDGGNSKYSNSSATAKADIISNFGWTITDGGLLP